MRAILITLTLILLAATTKAQRIRFSDPTNAWAMVHIEWPVTGMAAAWYGNDTIIAGKSYRQLIYHHQASSGILGIREDTSLGRVYHRFLNYHLTHYSSKSDTTEHLYFDYQLQVSDTMRWNIGTDTFKYVVQVRDSVLLGGTAYKHWKLDIVSQPTGSFSTRMVEFIEGVGAQVGPAFHILPEGFEQLCQLRCFTTRGSHPKCVPSIPIPGGTFQSYYLGTPVTAHFFDNDTSCIIQKVAVNTAAMPESRILIPNPAFASSMIAITDAPSEYIITITDAVGALKFREQSHGRTELPLGEHVSSPGIYYCTIRDISTGQLYCRRFIYQ